MLRVLQWRLSALPRYLPTADVDRMIALCDTVTPLGLRDGDVVMAYIQGGQPAVTEYLLLVRLIALYRPFTISSSIAEGRRRALREAGVTHPPSKGASLLRHSATTTMLCAGATIEIVFAVLRHRSLDVTAHYAKVDVSVIETIAQPWPGEASC